MLEFKYIVEDPTEEYRGYTAKVTIHEDVGPEGIYIAIKHFLLSAGFHPDTVSDILNEEEHEK